ncbi:MAG: DUF1801 domain-containing protein [Chitinophagaceae bacterium]|nr:DUF1801 domain-containing protein [Chitinophagaceae bacterium]
MKKENKLTDHEQVTELIQKLDPSLSDLAETVRQIILNTHNEIGEQIKWNSPAFYYTGEMKPFDPREYKRDIAVMNLRKNKLLLVFPSGAIINDLTGIFEGDYTDGRRLVNFSDLKDVKAKEKALRRVLKEWIKLVDR